MTISVHVLRPETGLSETMERLRRAGLTPIASPLFTIVAVPWSLPDLNQVDAVLLTSGNALRLGGDALAALRHLPVWCVGPVTAALAREAGFTVQVQGDADAAALLAGHARPDRLIRLLWLAGEEHSDLNPPPGITITLRAVYRTDPVAHLGRLPTRPSIIMVHSIAAAERLATWSGDRTTCHIIAISTAAAAATGADWASKNVAERPLDTYMVAMAQQIARMHAETAIC